MIEPRLSTMDPEPVRAETLGARLRDIPDAELERIIRSGDDLDDGSFDNGFDNSFDNAFDNY